MGGLLWGGSRGIRVLLRTSHDRITHTQTSPGEESARLVLDTCEAAAAAEGFANLELMATRAGLPLYEAFGFQPVEEIQDASGGTRPSR